MKLHLDSSSDIPLFRQIYQQLHGRIVTGDLQAGERLPPTRQIAKENKVARMTVNAAINQLKQEGFLVSRTGSGIYVSQAYFHLPHESTRFQPKLSKWSQQINIDSLAPTLGSSRSSQSTHRHDIDIDFGFGRPFASIFPYDIWRRLLGRYLSTDDAILSRYGSTAGFEPLRQAIATHVTRLRNVRCTADQVVIVNGIQQAFDILARILIDPGDEILVETPGYVNAFKVFQAYGARLNPLPVDNDGFPTAQIPANTQAKFVFVTPSNQFPHGGFMSLERRLQLLEWARNNDALIFEDDYDGELRYDGYPLAALQGLDQDGRVIYLGTFSKVLFPALRLGYIILPDALHAPFLQAKQLTDRGAPTLTQAAVADFITDGHFDRHLRRLRQVYGERQRTLISALKTELGDRVAYTSASAGLHIMLYLKQSGINEQTFIRQAAKAGVAIYAGAPYHFQKNARPSVLLGFSDLTQDEIEEGVRRLADILRHLETSTK